MEIIKTEIKDLFILKPNVIGDSRGYFCEMWNQKFFTDNGIDFKPLQLNESSSEYGVVRGLHYQLNPAAQAKLVRVVSGEVLDVVVDLRQDSLSYGKTTSVILSSENKLQFFIPRGFAHGFSVLSEKAVFSYLCDNLYMPELDRGINLSDKSLNIDWKIPENKRIISPKDLNHPNFIDAEKNF